MGVAGGWNGIATFALCLAWLLGETWFIQSRECPAEKQLAKQHCSKSIPSVPQVLALLQSAVPSCTDGRHQDAVRVLNCSLNSMDLDD